MLPPNETIRLPYSIPYYAQVASPELARAIFTEGLDPTHDPRWAETGAVNAQEYAYWTERACGVACLKMCVEALGGPIRPLLDWARAGVARGGYRIDLDENGRPLERGWVHRVLAEMIAEQGLSASAMALELEEFPTYLRAGQMIIASTSFEIGDNLPVTRKGGHLVVVGGAELNGSRLAYLRIHNPSGRSPELRIHARIPSERFAQGYSGRVILAGPASNPE
jgi:hypothetical protein